MTLTVLSVAFPFATVGPDAVGGAEQVLTALDDALVAGGHRSIVVAAGGSTTAGELVAIDRHDGTLDDAAWRAGHEQVRAAIRSVLERERVDLVHLHGVDCHRYLPPAGVPALATLHLPPDWYPIEVFRPARPDTWLQCVSESQRARCPASDRLVAVVPNGVPVERLTPLADCDGTPDVADDYAVALGRICPEKGFHLALEAARRAGAPLVLAGRVFEHSEHERYFAREIVPRLDHRRRFIGPVGLRHKRRLLSGARCLLVSSLVDETSSLVAMESLACGTPVVAFRVGALPEIVEHGRTGYLVDHADEMAEAIDAARDLDPAVCRAEATARFSAATMTRAYVALYRRLASGAPEAPDAPDAHGGAT